MNAASGVLPKTHTRIMEKTAPMRMRACHNVGMQNLYDNCAIRAMERAAFSRESSFAVMCRAGAAVARQAQAMCNTAERRPVLVAAGPGNNGGDALIAAAQLRTAGVEVHVVASGNQPPADAGQALAAWRDGGGQVLCAPATADYALAIDGLLGIGLTRTVEGSLAETIRRLRDWPTLAIDVPSGIDSDTGCRRGEAVCAARTITFFAAKPGLYTGDGAAAAGQVVVDTLQFEDFPPASGVLLDGADGLNLARLRRSKNSHKGSHGTALLIGGNDGMGGALVLAARAAVRIGAGKVYALVGGGRSAATRLANTGNYVAHRQSAVTRHRLRGHRPWLGERTIVLVGSGN